MRSTAILFVTLSLAGAALAQLSPEYATWGDGPVKYLMTTDDMTAWASVKTDAEAKAFIDLFWARRDPTPATSRNEFREEFDIRVLAADKNFTTPKAKGSLSDRGRVLILLGAPEQVGSRGGGNRAPGMAATANMTPDTWDGTVSSARGSQAMQTWNYRGEKKPKFIKRKEFEIIFVEESAHDWQLAKGTRVNPEGLLQEAVRAYIFSPDMTTLPVYADAPPVPSAPVRLMAFKTAALKEAYEQFRASSQSAIGSARLTWAEFVRPESSRFVALQLFVPAEAGIDASRDVTFFGAIENAAGEIVEVHEETVKLTTSGKDAFVDKSLPLAPGSYHAAFGLAADGRVVALANAEFKVDELDSAASGVSQMILSNNVYAVQPPVDPMDPFVFGDLKVVPKGDTLFSTADELWYFFEVRNPGLTEQGTPQVQVRVEIKGKDANGAPVRWELPPQDAEMRPYREIQTHYGLGMAFPLADFEPGDYTMKVRVFDAVLKKTYQFESAFKVRKL